MYESEWVSRLFTNWTKFVIWNIVDRCAEFDKGGSSSASFPKATKLKTRYTVDVINCKLVKLEAAIFSGNSGDVVIITCWASICASNINKKIKKYIIHMVFIFKTIFASCRFKLILKLLYFSFPQSLLSSRLLESEVNAQIKKI